MSFHKQIQRRINKKMQEIQELRDRALVLEREIQAASAALEAYKDALALAPSDEAGDGGSDLRPGSLTAQAYEALKAHRAPMHVTDLLSAMGKEPTRAARTSLSGSLSAYVRRSEIFTRTDPNTFGLIEWAEMPPKDNGENGGSSDPTEAEDLLQ